MIHDHSGVYPFLDYGTALVLELFGDVIAWWVAVIVASQSGHRLSALTADEDRALATTPIEALLALPKLTPETISERPVLSRAVIPSARHERRNLVESGHRGMTQKLSYEAFCSSPTYCHSFIIPYFRSFTAASRSGCPFS